MGTNPLLRIDELDEIKRNVMDVIDEADEKIARLPVQAKEPLQDKIKQAKVVAEWKGPSM